MQLNMEYDENNSINRAVGIYFNKCVNENIDGLDHLILNLLKAARQDGIYLWGAGKYGRLLAEYMKERNVKIHGIVDNHSFAIERCKFQVIPFYQVKEGAKIFIAIGDKKANEEIVKQVKRVHRETVVVRFQDLGRMKYEKYW
jgi:hypothetical protein